MPLNFLNNGYFAGTVGIGTNSPRGKLQINGNGNAWNDAPSVRLWDTTNSKGWLVGNVNNYTAGDFYIRTFASVNADPTSASQEFTIKHATGNVGIGTTSPAYKLDVVGSIKASVQGRFASGSAATPSYSFDADSDSGMFRATTNALGFSTAGSERMRIDSSGNVGIGATSPTSRLEIKATSATHKLVSINRPASDTAALYLGNDSASPANGVISSNYSDLIFGRDQSGTLSEWMRIKRDGNVGIGTTGPSNTLHVFKNATIGPITSPTVANAGLRIQDNGASLYVDGNSLATDSAGYLTTINNNHFDIGTNSTSRIHITGAGDVGIGITAPSEKLEVDGNVLITSALLSNQENTNVDTGAETVASVLIATYTAAFFDFVIKNGTNLRAGTVFACHDGTNVVYTETSTNDLGDTSDVTLSVDISGTDMRLRATVTSDDWIIKSLIRAI